MINDTGRVAGTTQEPDPNGQGPFRAVTWDEQRAMFDLHPETWPGSESVDMNNSGQVLLQRAEPNYALAQGGALWTPGQAPGEAAAIDPMAAGANSIDLRDLNDVGQVTGNLIDASEVPTAFVFDESNGLRKLTPPNGRFVAERINNAGTVAGILWHPDDTSSAAVWSAGTFTQVSLPGNPTPAIRGLNEAGAVLVNSHAGGDAFVWTPGADPVRIPSLGGGDVLPLAINEQGAVVGNSSVDRRETAFSWQPGAGIVSLGTLGGASHATAINESGTAVGGSYGANDGSGAAGATIWPETLNTPRSPTAPNAVIAIAGDQSALVAWSQPDDNGGLWLDYEVVGTPIGGGTPVAKTVTVNNEGSHTTTVTGLANDVEYAFTVTARNTAGTSAPAPTLDAVTPRAGISLPTTFVSAPMSSQTGGSLSTGWSQTEEEPVSTYVSVPGGTSGGLLTIGEGPIDLDAPGGYTFLGQQVNISAPVASADSPLRLQFTLHSSVIDGLDPDTVQIFRTEDGETTPSSLPDCTDPDGSVATPDPCVQNRYFEEWDGSLTITVLTSHASAWNFGVAGGEVEPFNFTGFLSPVDMAPTVNVTKAGRTIPIKFRLGGNQGLEVLAEGSPSSVLHACLRSAPQDTIETSLTGGEGALTYDEGADLYTYTWKTPKSFANSCRTFVLELSDGTSHVAEFEFR